MRDQISRKKVKKLVTAFKRLRLEQGLSQAQLAEKIGMSDRAIGMIENHQRIPTILTCFKLANGLGAKLDRLIADM